MIRIALALLVPLALLSPTAAAHVCPDEAPGATAIEPLGLYLTQDPSVWQETNTYHGLQKTAGSCVDDNGREYSWAADTRVV